MRATLLIILLGALAGCGGLPRVYKINIEQGNVVTGEMLSQLEPGMTRRQVRYVLGTPLLENSFNRNRWDYVYSLRRGGKTLRQERLTVFFEDDKLSHFTGTLVPRPRQQQPGKPPVKPAKPEQRGAPLPSLGGGTPGPAPSGDDVPAEDIQAIADESGAAPGGDVQVDEAQAEKDRDALVEALRTGKPVPPSAGLPEDEEDGEI